MACDDHCFPSSSLHHIGVGWKSQQTFFLEKLNEHISHEWSRAMSWPNPLENLIISRSLSFFFTLSHSYTILIFSSSHTFFFVVTTTEAHARARSFLFLGILISSIRETFFLSLSRVADSADAAPTVSARRAVSRNRDAAAAAAALLWLRLLWDDRWDDLNKNCWKQNFERMSFFLSQPLVVRHRV